MIYDIILNMEKSGIKPRIKVSQYDKTLPQIRATLYSNNQAFNIPSGSKVYISGTKKDNTGFKYECTYSNNEITADITEQMTAFSGDVEVEFTIESSGSRKGTENFILEVEKAALEDDVIISETDIPALQRLSQPASTTQLGVVKVDGTSVTVDEDGTLHSSGGGGGAVQSVNGKTGAVVLDADDIDDMNTTNKFTNATEKQAWNGKSTVSVTQIKSSGEKIATINVNGTDTDLYASAGGGGGTTDYTDLTNKPSVNGVTLSGNKTSADLGISGADDVSAILNVYGSKNLNVYPYQETTETLNGVTFRDNGDGSITVSGATTSAYAVFSIRLDGVSPFKLKKGTYKLSGCPNKSGLSIVFQFNVNGETISAVDTGSGATFTLTADAKTKWCYLYVDSNVDLTTAETFYPMLRDARISDATFVPYALTNRELTSKTSGLSNRNLLDNPWFTVNQRGATTLTNAGYGADRWKYIGGTSITFSSNGLTLDNGLASTFFEEQLKNGTYTASVLLSDGTIYYGKATKYNNTDALHFIDNSYIRVDYYADLKRFDINNAFTNATLTIRAVKLELGAESTLALDVEPNYTEELLKCQRYYFPLAKDSNMTYFGEVTLSNSKWISLVNIPLPTEMRATPTFSGSVTSGDSQGTAGSLTNFSIGGKQHILFSGEWGTGYTPTRGFGDVIFTQGAYLSAEL